MDVVVKKKRPSSSTNLDLKNKLKTEIKPFTMQELNIVIDQLNENAAPSIVDKIPTNVFKMLSLDAKKVFLNILNKKKMS